jgi:hypothetical protein
VEGGALEGLSASPVALKDARSLYFHTGERRAAAILGPGGVRAYAQGRAGLKGGGREADEEEWARVCQVGRGRAPVHLPPPPSPGGHAEHACLRLVLVLDGEVAAADRVLPCWERDAHTGAVLRPYSLEESLVTALRECPCARPALGCLGRRDAPVPCTDGLHVHLRTLPPRLQAGWDFPGAPASRVRCETGVAAVDAVVHGRVVERLRGGDAVRAGTPLHALYASARGSWGGFLYVSLRERE